MAFGPLHPADRRGDLRGENSVVGGLVCQLPNGAEADVDGGRRQALLLERQTVALDGSLGKTLRATRSPSVEVIESLAVSPAGVGGGKTVEDEGFQVVPGS